jgi:hypothetical protein
MVNKSKKNYIKNKYNTTRKGGKAIGSGGYGCVFFPALKCKNNKNRKINYISKLLLNKYAENEYEEINNLKSIVKNIPNYQKYFLVDNITICKPNNLSNKDIENINICNSIFEITNNNLNEINSKLNRFKILNIPYGGIDLLNIINNKKVPIKNINSYLQKLLNNAILPMNKLGLFHNDIKSQNVLYLDNNTRLIDWGISFYSKNKYINKIQDRFNFILLYNRPLTSIIFNDYFDLFFDRYIKNNKRLIINNKNLESGLEIVMYNYYFYFLDFVKKYGHEEFLNNYFYKELFKISNINNNFILDKDYNFTALIFSQQMTKILIKYTNFNTKKFDKLRYFNEVFIKNLDVYGFITIYIEYLFINIDKNIKINICNLLIKYCFSDEYSDKVIDINNLNNDLNNLIKNNNTNVNLKKLFNIKQ